MAILQLETPMVKATAIIGIDAASAGDKVTIILRDDTRQRTVAIFPNDLLGSYPRFQRAVLRASGIYFHSPRFEGACGRRKWKRVVMRLIRGPQ